VDALLVSSSYRRSRRGLALDRQRTALQPPHPANRHDAGCGVAGADRVAAVTSSGLAVRLGFPIADQTDRTDAEQQESGWLRDECKQ